MDAKKGSRLRRKFLPGEALVKEGERSGWAYLILKGRVRVTKKLRGHEQVLAELGPNDLVGEMSIIDQKPRSATVSAIVETDALMLNLANLREVMQENPESAIVIFRALATKLREANEKLLRGFSSEEVGFWHRVITVTKLWVDATANRLSDRKVENLRRALHTAFGTDEEEAQKLIDRMIAAEILTAPAESEGFVIRPRRLDQFLEAYDILHADQEGQSKDKLTAPDLDVCRHILAVVEQKSGKIPGPQVVVPTAELKEKALSRGPWLSHVGSQREQFWEDCVARLVRRGLLKWPFGRRTETIVFIEKMRDMLNLGLEQGGAFYRTCDLLTGRKR
jgi:CRP-like cAMP-binding protein